MLETYEETSSEPLDCPITALGGASDPAVSSAKLEGWRSRTSAEFTNHEFRGEHFYIEKEREAVMASIIKGLSHSL